MLSLNFAKISQDLVSLRRENTPVRELVIAVEDGENTAGMFLKMQLFLSLRCWK